MINENNRISGINTIKKALWVILLISFAIEMFWFHSWNNLMGCAVSLLSTLLYFKCILKIDVMRRRPISFVATLYLFLFMYLPLPTTLMDGNEISHGMTAPQLTFLLQFLFFCCAIVAFNIADSISKHSNGVYLLLKWSGFFEVPTNAQLWILAIIGFFFKLFIAQNQYGDETISGLGTLSMFSLFIYSPICIYFKDLLGNKSSTGFEKKFVWVYMIALSVFLVSTNSRSQMLSPFVVWFCCYLIKTVYANNHKHLFSYKKIVLAVLSILVVLGPATDMGYAMLIVRGERTGMPFAELLNRSIEVFQDKKQIEVVKAIEQMQGQESGDFSSGMWNESYVSSIFLNRLCNYRVADQSIYYAQKAGYGNTKMLELFGTTLLIAPVGPIAKRLTNVDKSDYEFSAMDYLYYLNSGSGLGGYKVGGDVGLGLATFGVLFYPLMLIVYILVFVLLNSVARFANGHLTISFITLISIYFSYFLKFQVANGLVAQVIYVLWSFWWTMFWYILVYKIVRVIVRS